MKFSVFVPIHNEERMLPYSLSCVKQLNPDQVILGFDRCTDDSVQVADKILDRYDSFTVKTKNDKWRWPLCYDLFLAQAMARNPILFVVSADTVFRNVEKGLSQFENPQVGWVTFPWLDYPPTLKSHLIKLIGKTSELLGYRQKATGINYAFRTRAFTREDWNRAQHIPIAVDTFIRTSIVAKNLDAIQDPSGFCLHLRPVQRDYSRDYLTGSTRYVYKYGFLQTARSAIIYMRPLMIAGWLKAYCNGYPRKSILEW